MIRHPAYPPTPPVVFGPLGPAFLIAGSAIQAAGAVRGGIAQNKQAKAQARVERQRATSERTAAAAEEQDARRSLGRDLGTIRARLGASGVDLATGSPVTAMEDFVSEAELAALRIRHGGETRATRLEQQADLIRESGRDARTRGFVRGGSLLLTGAGRHFQGR